jgi:hypothetical protein
VTYKRSEDLGGLGAGKSLVVDNLPIALERLTNAIELFESRGIRVADLGRLNQGRSTLEKVIRAGRYPSDQASLRRIANAVRLCQDFETIAESVPQEVAGRLAGELQQALKGTLDGGEKTRRPFQFQSQFWFGGALLRAGFDVLIPSDRSKNPDFVLTPGAVTYGVEVKRPGTAEAAEDALRKAREQLDAAGTKGIVVFDLSDCLEHLGLRRFVHGAVGRGYEDLKPHYRILTDSLGEIVWDAERREHRAGYTSVIGLWSLARGWLWDLDDLTSPRLFDMQGMQRFASAKGNVWYYIADEFFHRLVSALRESGFAIHEVEQESKDPIRTPYWENWRK